MFDGSVVCIHDNADPKTIGGIDFSEFCLI